MAGRLGGEKGRQIVYDDADLDKLIDRHAISPCLEATA